MQTPQYTNSVIQCLKRREVKWSSEASSTGSISKVKLGTIDRKNRMSSLLASFMTSNAGVTTGRTRERSSTRSTGGIYLMDSWSS